MPKQELSLSTEQSILELVKAFELCTLPLDHWTHRAHLAVGAFYVRSMTLEHALPYMRTRIQRYNHSHNNPTGYNETITRLFLGKMADDLQTGAACATLPEEIDRLATLCNLQWLYRFYSQTVIHSELAKSQWVEPDLQSVDFPLAPIRCID